jgi:hypothetical protein
VVKSWTSEPSGLAIKKRIRLVEMPVRAFKPFEDPREAEKPC